MKALIIISLLFCFSFGAKTTEKSLNECLYELHKLSNELNGILYFGFKEQFEEGQAQEALNNIELYAHETAEFKSFMANLKSGYDKSQDPTYFLKRAHKKESELNAKAKECKRLKK